MSKRLAGVVGLTAMLLAGCGAATDDTGTVQAGDNTPDAVNSF